MHPLKTGQLEEEKPKEPEEKAEEPKSEEEIRSIKILMKREEIHAEKRLDSFSILVTAFIQKI